MNKEAKILFGIGGVVIIVLVVLGLLFGDSKPSDEPVADSILISADSQQQPATGEEKVVLVEFSDFQCPACSVTEPTVAQLRTKYAENMRFVYREFPLNSHQHAELAALAAEAAAAQGAFWPMHDKLFAQQSEWGSLSNPLDAVTVREKFIGYATDLGLDVTQFTADLDNKTYQSVIQQGKSDGAAANVTATPSFFVNGVATNTSDLDVAIQDALK